MSDIRWSTSRQESRKDARKFFYLTDFHAWTIAPDAVSASISAAEKLAACNISIDWAPGATLLGGNTGSVRLNFGAGAA